MPTTKRKPERKPLYEVLDSYKAYSVFDLYPEDSMFEKAMRICTDQGATKEQAKEIAALYFAINQLDTFSLDDPPEGVVAPISELCADMLIAYREIRDKSPALSLEECTLLYASVCLTVAPDSPDNAQSSRKETIRANKGEVVKPVKVESFVLPLDKVNSRIWNLPIVGNTGGMRLKAEKAGAKKHLDILCAINFDELGENTRISRQLTPYDKRVYVAVANLYAAGNEWFSAKQVYNAMGCNGNPSKQHYEQIHEALTKMLRTTITVDNEQEAKEYKYPVYKYTGSLLPMEVVSKVLDGQIVDDAVHLLRDPPAFTFAKERMQITSIPVALLQSPVSKTTGNLAVEDYLLARISHMKNGSTSHRILYATVCRELNITEKKSQQRLPEKVRRYLGHYVDQRWISSFTEADDGVNITLPTK